MNKSKVFGAFSSAAVLMAVTLALAACNSTESVLKVEGSSQTPANDAAAAPATGTGTGVSTPVPAVAAAGIRMRLAPIIGAPVDKVNALNHRLNSRATAAKIEIVPSTDATATHVLKGYFSVLGEGTSTTVVYVFDVLDPAGNRLHRIQGQETAPGSNAADPWASVPATLMETIADKAMTEFINWSVTRAS